MKIYYQNPENSMKYFSHFKTLKSMRFDPVLIIKSPILQWNLLKSWPKFMVKFIENQIKSCTTPYSILRENHWKLIINSLKINENQWNLWPKLRENQLFLNQILIKLIIKLSYFWTKLTQILGWDTIWNNGFGLRGHKFR